VDPAVDEVLARRERLARPSQAALGLAAAILLHAGAVAVIVLLPRLIPPPPPLDYVAVQVVPAQRLGVQHPGRRAERQPEPTPPRQQEPPPPEPPPRPSDAPVLHQPPPPKTPTPAKPPKAAPQKPLPPDNRVDPTLLPKTLPPPREVLAQKLAALAPKTPPPVTGAAGPAGAATGAVNGKVEVGSSITTLDNPDFTYDYYIAQLLSRIDQNWTRPPVGAGVHAIVSFHIQSDGSIADLQVRQSSGFDTFDLAALRAVQNASPFPPLPRAYTVGHNSLGVNLSVR
jgi:TonB family protein